MSPPAPTSAEIGEADEHQLTRARLEVLDEAEEEENDDQQTVAAHCMSFLIFFLRMQFQGRSLGIYS